MNGVRHRVADMLVALDRDEEAIDLYRLILRRDSDHVCCFHHLGDIYRKLSRNHMAERMYGSLVAGCRRLMAAPGPKAHHWRRELVSFYLDEKRELAHALELMRATPDAELSEPDRFLLARCLEANRHFDEAVTVLASIESDDPKLMRNVTAFKDGIVAYRSKKQ